MSWGMVHACAHTGSHCRMCWTPTSPIMCTQCWVDELLSDTSPPPPPTRFLMHAVSTKLLMSSLSSCTESIYLQEKIGSSRCDSASIHFQNMM